MRINWVLSSDAIIDVTLDIEVLKKFGTFWGSWETLRSCGTDNIVCHDESKAVELLSKKFNQVCNFYCPKTVGDKTDIVGNVFFYDGNFSHQVDRPDEIVTLHLVSSLSDIVLLYGFDWSNDGYLDYRGLCYRNLVKEVIRSNVDVQWVVVDGGELFEELVGLDNLSVDTMDNVISLISQLSA